MANPQQQVEKGRQAVRAFVDGINGMAIARETLIDLGGLDFIAFLDDTDLEEQPIYDISSADMIAALITAFNAIEAVLEANGRQHYEALRKLL